MVALSCPAALRSTRPPRRPGLVLAAILEPWLERRRQRRALLALDERLLSDFGIGAAEAWQEGRKPFWRA
jgi:uncharacterized protein YjiS (DUF1127 family)